MTETLSRRELNKARTREAIIAALRDQVARRPVDQITVDQLAEAADISRRTFFNYFPSMQAVVAEVIGTHTEHLADAIGDLTGPVGPIDRLREVIRTVGIPTELLEWLAMLNLHTPTEGPSETLVTLERAIWAEKSGWLEQQLARRLPAGADELYVATLAATVMSCFAAAEQVWIARRAPRPPLDRAAVAAFHTELDRALAYAGDGWAARS